MFHRFIKSNSNLNKSFRLDIGDTRTADLLAAASDGDHATVERLLEEYSFDVVDHPKLFTKLVELMLTSMPYLRAVTRSRLPVHAALIMCKAFRHVAHKHRAAAAVMKDYAQLCEHLSIEMLYELLDSMDGDVERLRNEVFELRVQVEWSSGTSQWHTAIEMAVQLKSAMFISCPLCQLYLDALWHGPHRIANDDDRWYRTMFEDMALFTVSPRGRCWFFNVMYLTFVALTTQVLLSRSYPIQAFSWTEVSMYIILLGLIMHEIQQLMEESMTAYFSSLWNWLDLVLYMGFITAFVLRILDFTAPDHSLDASCNCHFYSNMSFDVISCVDVIIWLRILHMMSSFMGLGVLMVSMRNMMTECAKFLVFMVAVFWGFMSAFYALFRSPIGDRTELSYLDVFWLLLQALFGQWFVDISNWTAERYLSQFMFILYLLISVIILLNLMIGVFSAAIARVQGNAEAEYKFDRCLTILEFAEDRGIPPPFNLIAMFGVVLGDVPLWIAEILTLTYMSLVFLPLILFLLLAMCAQHCFQKMGLYAKSGSEYIVHRTSNHRHILEVVKATGCASELRYGGSTPVIVREDPSGWDNQVGQAMLQQRLLDDMLNKFSSELTGSLQWRRGNLPRGQDIHDVAQAPPPRRTSARRGSVFHGASPKNAGNSSANGNHLKDGESTSQAHMRKSAAGRSHNIVPIRSSLQLQQGYKRDSSPVPTRAPSISKSPVPSLQLDLASKRPAVKMKQQSGHFLAAVPPSEEPSESDVHISTLLMTSITSTSESTFSLEDIHRSPSANLVNIDLDSECVLDDRGVVISRPVSRVGAYS